MSLRDKLFGVATSLKDKIHEMAAPVTYTAPTTPEGNPQTDPLLTATPPAKPDVKVEDGALVPSMSPKTEQKPKMDTKKLIEAIGYTESRGQGTDAERYAFSRDSGYKHLGKAIGKYQVTEGEIKDYGEKILGRKITPDEFQKNPQLQEEYMQKKVELMQNDAPDATPEELMALHNKGLPGRADPEVRKSKVNEAGDYVSTGMRYMNGQTQSSTGDDLKDEHWQDPAPPGAVISAYNPTVKDTIAGIIDKVKEKIPFMDSNEEKAVREQVINAYPLTPLAQKIFTDVNMNFAPRFSGNIKGTYNSTRGDKTSRFMGKHYETLQKLPNKVLSTALGETMNLEQIDAATAMHEGFHALFQRSDFQTEDFLKDWEASKVQSSDADTEGNIHALLPWIEKHVSGDEAYAGIPDDARANEYFAYLGEIAGSNGLKGIPGSLRKYYSDTLKDEDTITKDRVVKKNFTKIALNDLSRQ